MLFSYGFIEHDLGYTSGLTLDLAAAADDPLGRAKEAVATTAAAVRLSYDGASTRWESVFVWLACVNEEDGLRFALAENTDGGRELRLLWKEQDITDDSGALEAMLRADALWDLFQLRAVTVIQERVAGQMQRLSGTGHVMAHAQQSPCVGAAALDAARSLQALEMQLLASVARDVEEQVRVPFPSFTKCQVQVPGASQTSCNLASIPRAIGPPRVVSLGLV